MSRVPTASLEPYLRARAVNPNLIPSIPTRRPVRRARKDNDDFKDFLHKLVKIMMSPIVLPIHWIHQAITSPLTINLILKLLLLFFLTIGSAVFSFIAVGAWWYSWGTGGPVEVEGWLFYGSKSHRTPHVQISLPIERFQEDLRYDVQADMELVRPIRGGEEMGNFMLSLELRSARDPDVVVLRAAQPSLPPPPLPSSLFYIPSFPTQLLPPCIIPWPFRSLCPSRMLGYDRTSGLKPRDKRNKGAYSSPARGKDVVLLRKDLMEGVVILPSLRRDSAVGSAFVSLGREDSFTEATDAVHPPKEVRTTGWVVVRFIPRPTGVRWLLSAHPLPPLILLPPLSLILTISSSIIAFGFISYLIRPRTKAKKPKKPIQGKGTSEEILLEEKRRRTFEEKDRQEREEEERRKREWEEVESSALGGLRDMPAERKRSSAGGSTTIGGSETTAPSRVRSFGATSVPSEITERSEETERGRGRRESRDDTSDGWTEAD